MERQFCSNKTYKKKKGAFQNDIDEKIYTLIENSFPNMAKLPNLLKLLNLLKRAFIFEFISQTSFCYQLKIFFEIVLSEDQHTYL